MTASCAPVSQHPGTARMSWLDQLHRLQHLENDLALLPVGWGAEGKAPMLRKEEDWPHHPGFTIDQLRNVAGIKSVGTRTGLLTGPLMAFDFDGRSAFHLGLDPADFRTWQIHRDNDPFRLKVLCQPTPEQISQLPDIQPAPRSCQAPHEFQGKRATAPGRDGAKGEALEVFFAGGRQVVILGRHPSSRGNYFWPDGYGPEQLAPPPQAWLDFAISCAKGLEAEQAALPRKGSTSRAGTRKCNPCPICGRHSGKGGSSLWCEETTRGLILCMPGNSFSAEQKHGPLTIGKSVVNGYALVAKTSIPEGVVHTFKPDTRRKRRAF